ncbi:MAG: hypothetical protein NTW26_01115 [bacterium]|nr:hypothetical protein [bacterium]
MRASVLAALAAAALFVCLSCLIGTGSGDGDQPDQTTVLGTLNLFEDVWNDGDMDAYEGLLDEENFIFHFDPADVWGDIPPFWGYEEEIQTYKNLFSQVGVSNVSAQLDLSGIVEPEEEAVTCSLDNIAYLLYVEVPDLDAVLKADGRLDLQLEKRGGEWVVTEWTDNSILHLPGIYEVSWGRLKGYFIEDDDE